VRLIKKHTREYAKRQLIYFKREPDVHWIDVTGEGHPKKFSTKS
jgi:tRNA A37 N6-isopentenylltransferase MiaA